MIVLLRLTASRDKNLLLYIYFLNYLFIYFDLKFHFFSQIYVRLRTFCGSAEQVKGPITMSKICQTAFANIYRLLFKFVKLHLQRALGLFSV